MKRPQSLCHHDGSRMPEYLHPGVYVEESDQSPHPISGVPTLTAAFVGIAESGPNVPTLVTSVAEYQQAFESSFDQGFLGYAVRGFFQNGGTRCYILRAQAD